MLRRTLTLIALVCACAAPAQASDWTSTGNLNAAERNRSAAALLHDGSVLVMGGTTDGFLSPGTPRPGRHVGGPALNSAERFDPTTNTWASLASPVYARFGATATTLRDGRVLVAGGESPWGAPGEGELFDPATATWERTGPNYTGHARARGRC
jgi:hypothetical protein